MTSAKIEFGPVPIAVLAVLAMFGAAVVWLGQLGSGRAVLMLIGLLAAEVISVLVIVQLVAAGLVSRVAPRDVRCR